jgi:hypothetical protein
MKKKKCDEENPKWREKKPNAFVDTFIKIEEQNQIVSEKKLDLKA